MKKDFFKQNPQLIEFAKKLTTSKAEDDKTEEGNSVSTNNKKKKKKEASRSFGPGQNKKVAKHKEMSLLKWGNPFFGIYDRYGAGKSNLDKCWCFAGPGNDDGIP